jgi:hypothetical protein
MPKKKPKFTPKEIESYLELPDSQQWLIEHKNDLSSNQQVKVIHQLKYGFALKEPNVSGIAEWLESKWKWENKPSEAIPFNTWRNWLSSRCEFPRDKFFQLLIMLRTDNDNPISFAEAEKYIDEAYPNEALRFYDWEIKDFCYHVCLNKGWGIDVAKEIIGKSKEILKYLEGRNFTKSVEYALLDIFNFNKEEAEESFRKFKVNSNNEDVDILENDRTLTDLIIEKSPSEIRVICSEDDVYRHVMKKADRFILTRESPRYELDEIGCDELDFNSFKQGYYVKKNNFNAEQLNEMLNQHTVKIDRLLFIELLLYKGYGERDISDCLDSCHYGKELDVAVLEEACVYEACSRAGRDDKEGKESNAWNYYVDNIKKIFVEKI